ncbi:YuzF family protein [Paenalkalicoccus suaedae]|uniref:YuzF family protein n=1 Tax=Paenalkalicoccus suaedae TaxID=2592382 RepID=A0A859FHH8_9BACI|nr:YuzF family protein [Paenalkalicoccus suaedae]QKS72134.1 YuzF family protein [Paenalkalicoccus suaedae]
MYEQERNASVEYKTLFDPFVYQTLVSVRGSMLNVQTTKGSVRGRLEDVKPDHIVVSSGGASFFIRIQEIVWVSPSQDREDDE